MATYTKTTDFAAKDALASGNPSKIVKGTEIGTEFDNIASCVGTSGFIVQSKEATPYTTYSNTTAAIPSDDTIPQNTEGTEIITITFTPTSASNRLVIDVDVPVIATSGSTAVIFALFQDSSANAIAAAGRETTTAIVTSLAFRHEMAAGTTSTITFSVRCGTAAGTLYINGNATERKFGGIAAVRLRVTEYKV